MSARAFFFFACAFKIMSRYVLISVHTFSLFINKNLTIVKNFLLLHAPADKSQ